MNKDIVTGKVNAARHGFENNREMYEWFRYRQGVMKGITSCEDSNAFLAESLRKALNLANDLLIDNKALESEVRSLKTNKIGKN